MATVYLETTIISYLAARPSRDPRNLSEQQATHEWWQKTSAKFQLVVSPFVMDEVARGDPDAAARRLLYLRGARVLSLEQDPGPLAKAIRERARLGASADWDCLHVAVAALGAVDFLLTWNMRHIGGAHLRRLIESVCAEHGVESPVICSPPELMEVPDVA